MVDTILPLTRIDSRWLLPQSGDRRRRCQRSRWPCPSHPSPPSPPPGAQRTSTAANVHAPPAATSPPAPPAPAPTPPAPAPFLDTYESLVARGDLSNVDVLKRMARMMARPALRYVQTCIFDKCAKQVSLLKTARILDPRHAAAMSSMVAARVDELVEAHRFFKLERFAWLPDKTGRGRLSSRRTRLWWPRSRRVTSTSRRGLRCVKQAHFPALSTALRSVLCHIPNSAPPERLFSILNGNVGDDQLRAKAD